MSGISQFEFLPMNEKNSTSCPRNTPTNVCPEDFKILEKENEL
jgi:pSer/pThr/pTyr-binding forkhead associated (FHA) protein